MNTTEITEVFRKQNFHNGRMISPSKSGYRLSHPGNDVIFNASVFVLGEGKVFWGDLDITLDEEKLKEIATEIGKSIFILREGDSRADDMPDSDIISRAHKKIEA